MTRSREHRPTPLAGSAAGFFTSSEPGNGELRRAHRVSSLGHHFASFSSTLRLGSGRVLYHAHRPCPRRRSVRSTTVPIESGLMCDTVQNALDNATSVGCTAPRLPPVSSAACRCARGMSSERLATTKDARSAIPPVGFRAERSNEKSGYGHRFGTLLSFPLERLPKASAADRTLQKATLTKRWPWPSLSSLAFCTAAR